MQWQNKGIWQLDGYTVKTSLVGTAGHRQSVLYGAVIIYGREGDHESCIHEGDAHMLLQMQLCSKLFPTDVTFMWPLSCVYMHMPLHVMSMNKLLPTDVTFVWILVHMHKRVSLYSTKIVELFLRDVTFVWFLPCMCHNVLFDVPL